MQPQLVGYFPKLSEVPAGWEFAPQVRELCSVSTCIAPAPPDWIDHWRHNELGFFNTPSDARSVVPAGAAGFHVFAYRLQPVYFIGGKRTELALPPLTVEPLVGLYVSLGFDAVSKSLSAFFECSPLSCNGEAAKHPVNQHCLFSRAAEAEAAAAQWSLGHVEPGDYYVLEVLRPGAGV